MNTARQTILDRIRAAYALRGTNKARDDSYDAIPPAYHRAGSLDAFGRIALFQNRLQEYGACVRFASSTDIPRTIADIFAARRKRKFVIPSGLPVEWLPQDVSFTTGDQFTSRDLECFDGVLTGCTVAIATTGTLVLQNAARQGPRKLSLVPDYHLCVVFADQIVETVPEAFDRLAPTATLPTTFISGPSATSDIEMTRIQGVHGPRFLDALIVDGSEIDGPFSKSTEEKT
ncbi:MAG: LUD domain-containing protein [Acidobacteriaceae bacterium]